MKKSIIILTLVFLLCFTGILYAQESLKIYFLDVGHGDASIIISSSGQVAMIDSGPNEKLILSYLKNLNISNIDLLIASHAHPDHITGMDKIIAQYKPKAFIDPGIPHTTRSYKRMITLLKSITSITMKGLPERSILDRSLLLFFLQLILVLKNLS